MINFSDNHNFIDKQELCFILHNKVKQNNISYFDALLEYVEENNIDAEDVNNILDPSIKACIYNECVNNNLLTEKQLVNINKFF